MAILALEAFILLAVSTWLIASFEKKIFHFEQDDMLLLETDGSNVSGSYLDYSYTEAKSVVTPEIALPSGIYYVEVVYNIVGPAYAGMEYTVPREDRELVNGNEFALNPVNERVAYKISVKDGAGVYFRVRQTGDATDGDYIQLLEVNIVRSKLSYLYPIACLIAFILIFDLLLFVFLYEKKWKNSNKIIIPILAIIAFLLGLPLYQPGIVGGIDLPFHMNRIEGICEGLKEGQFPVRIQPGWLNGYGYAVSIFYGDILLYFPAILRLTGFSLEDAMKAYLIAVNFLTIFSAWFSFKKCLWSSASALTAAVLYAGASDRLLRLYNSSQIGAVSAMIFYPVVFAGLYLLFTKEKRNGTERIWLWLLAGFSGLLMTHLLSCLMIGIFTVISCFLLIRRLFKKDVLIEVGKAFGAWLLLNAWFLVPFVQYMTKDFGVTSKLAENAGQSNPYVTLAGYVKDSLTVSDIFSEKGIGYGLTLVFFSALIMIILGGKSQRQKEGCLILCLAVCAGFFSMRGFPIIGLAQMSDVFLKLFRTVQYGNRFLSVAVLFLSCLGGYLILIADDKYKKKLAVLLCGITLLQSMLMFEGYSAGRRILEPVDLGYGLLNIGNGEYVPEGTDLSVLDKTLWYDEAAVQVSEVENRYLVWKAYVRNPGKMEQMISFPVLYYDGYQCLDLTSNKLLKIYAGENNRVSVIIPAEYSGMIQIKFVEYWHWRVAEGISLITFVVIIGYMIKCLRKKKSAM
ncbi:MAG TPA: hypothetical protein H9717_11460 [Candidatus Eisenbergiella merdipullorum]|uniref:Membrane protein 6-pyruvoyl-tetrahydropterin synthase-related domain-containing protein n=1 Tax=Candidatus Eisenbergiella merdipullorum TaxID=2838553 RepID=A0A9D2I8U0_9FIRM|nr:hypothetical protein [Candidatus Eisenbergiella merdipullorum]